MKTLLLSAALLVVSAADVVAQPIGRAQPSGRATAEVVLSPNSAPTPVVIRLDYGVPSLRGRRLHTDSLVPYNTVWRTGANAATTLKTDVDLTIGTTSVPKGTYAVFTLPAQQGWKLILQKFAGQDGTTYEAAADFARIDLRRTTLTAPIESLSMWLIPSTAAGPAHGELRMAWGTVQLSADWKAR